MTKWLWPSCHRRMGKQRLGELDGDVKDPHFIAKGSRPSDARRAGLRLEAELGVSTSQSGAL